MEERRSKRSESPLLLLSRGRMGEASREDTGEVSTELDEEPPREAEGDWW